MLKGMTAGDMAGWQRYYAQEPFGPYADWLRTGTVAATIANTVAPKEEGFYVPSDFVPWLKQDDADELGQELGPPEQAEERTPDDMFQQVYQMTKLMGGSFKDLRGQKKKKKRKQKDTDGSYDDS